MKRKILLMFSILFILTACKQESKEVVIYTSVDQNISEVILNEFEQETGIKVLAVYDIEAAKTTGLTNRLIAEKNNPQADVFWNSEILMTLKLKEEGIFQKMASKNTERLPENFIDKEGYWIGFGGRGRIILVNTDIVTEADYPTSIFDFIDSRYITYDKAIANPLFGTTMTHSIVLNHAVNRLDVESFFHDMKRSNTRIVDGNSVVRDLVSSGEVAFGLTDTDDAFSAVEKGEPVKIIFPDQETIGALIIPNTVAMINNNKHPDEAQILIDYLLSIETENRLKELGFLQISTDDMMYMICDFEAAFTSQGDLFERLRAVILE